MISETQTHQGKGLRRQGMSRLLRSYHFSNERLILIGSSCVFIVRLNGFPHHKRDRCALYAASLYRDGRRRFGSAPVSGIGDPPRGLRQQPTSRTLNQRNSIWSKRWRYIPLESARRQERSWSAGLVLQGSAYLDSNAASGLHHAARLG